MRNGGCQCERVRYRCPDNPAALYVCHCTNCRAQSASAFGISYIIASSGLEITQGAPAFWEWDTDSGRRSRGAFCPDCGTRLWHQGIEGGELSVKGGSLDEPVDLSKAEHIWVSSKLPGVVIPDAARQFPGEPE